jgi:hypothetical protein
MASPRSALCGLDPTSLRLEGTCGDLSMVNRRAEDIRTETVVFDGPVREIAIMLSPKLRLGAKTART